MVYRLFVYSKRTKEYESKGNYKTKQIAETKAQAHIDKNRKVKVIPIPTDELQVGMKVYKSDGELYGKIIDESNSFWYIRREGREEDDKAMFLKDGFIEKYENGVFIMKEGD